MNILLFNISDYTKWPEMGQQIKVEGASKDLEPQVTLEQVQK